MTGHPRALEIHPGAEAELLATSQAYDASREGHGELFLNDVENALELARCLPRMYPEVELGIRRIALRRFPFVIYYRFDLEANTLAVLGCLPARGDPEEGSTRLTDRASGK